MGWVELIRRGGLPPRRDERKTCPAGTNRLCIEMGHGRRQAGSAKKRKGVLRRMKRLVKIVRGHAVSHRALLDQEWEQTERTRRQAEQILKRIEPAQTQLPAAVTQTTDRHIG